MLGCVSWDREVEAFDPPRTSPRNTSCWSWLFPCSNNWPTAQPIFTRQKCQFQLTLKTVTGTITRWHVPLYLLLLNY